MVLEVAQFDVTDAEAFQAAYLSAREVLITAPGCRSVRMTRGVESPTRFTLLVEWGGMTPMQAILAATKNASELLGWEDRIGSLTAGKFADVIAVPGDPLADISVMNNPVFVMKNGVVYKGGSTQGVTTSAR